jgi:cytochrome c oxidase assembly factor CtaG
VPDLWAWHWRPDVPLVLLALGTLYARGWWRLRRVDGPRLAPTWRLAAYQAGLLTVGLALLSPVAALAHVLFTAHMIQHQLLLMIAPVGVLLGNPLPYLAWGLPRRLRPAVQAALRRESPVRQALDFLTWLPVAGVLYTLDLWLWHLPGAYEAALRHGVVHDLEHLAFFTGALLFWWPLINPAPRQRWPRGGLYYGARIAYLVFATAQNTLLGAILGLTERVLYPSYAPGSGLFGLSALDDQALGGGIMWSGGHMYLIPVLLLLWQAMEGEGGKPAPPPVAVGDERRARDRGASGIDRHSACTPARHAGHRER